MRERLTKDQINSIKNDLQLRLSPQFIANKNNISIKKVHRIETNMKSEYAEMFGNSFESIPIGKNDNRSESFFRLRNHLLEEENHNVKLMLSEMIIQKRKKSGEWQTLRS